MFDVTNNLLLLSTSSTKTFAVAPEESPVIVSPNVNFALESSKTILSPFSSKTKFTVAVSWTR